MWNGFATWLGVGVVYALEREINETLLDAPTCPTCMNLFAQCVCGCTDSLPANELPMAQPRRTLRQNRHSCVTAASDTRNYASNAANGSARLACRITAASRRGSRPAEKRRRRGWRSTAK